MISANAGILLFVQVIPFVDVAPPSPPELHATYKPNVGEYSTDANWVVVSDVLYKFQLTPLFETANWP